MVDKNVAQLPSFHKNGPPCIILANTKRQLNSDFRRRNSGMDNCILGVRMNQLFFLSTAAVVDTRAICYCCCALEHMRAN